MDNLKRLLSELCTEESGQDIVEYALVAAFVALATIAAVSRVGSAANSVFNAVGARISSSV